MNLSDIFAGLVTGDAGGLFSGFPGVTATRVTPENAHHADPDHHRDGVVHGVARALLVASRKRARISRKTIARGRPECFRFTCMLVCAFS
jgi:hypothetical protein